MKRLLIALLLTGCSQVTVPQNPPVPTPIATATPSPLLSTPAPTPTATPIVPVSTPAASATPKTSPLPQSTTSNEFSDPSCNGLTLNVFPLDASGWTILPSLTQPGRHVIYVSAKNTLHNDGTNFWVQTAEQGVLLLRKGLPDSLLFNRGETFHL